MKLTPAIRAALLRRNRRIHRPRRLCLRYGAVQRLGRRRRREVPAERLALLGGIWDGAHCTIPELIKMYSLTQTGFARILESRCAPCRTGGGGAAGMPAVCGRDGGGDSGCKRTITKTKPVE